MTENNPRAAGGSASGGDGGFEAFARRAEGATLVPVWRECVLDTDTPVSAFAKLRRGPFAFLLESAPAGGETWARYTFMGTEPASAWRLQAGVVEDWTPDNGWHDARQPSDPLGDLERRLVKTTPADVPELGQFWGGAVGFLGDEVVHHMEKLGGNKSGPPLPDSVFLFTRALVILDNLRSSARIVIAIETHGGPRENLRAAYDAAQLEIDEIQTRLTAVSELPQIRLDLAAPAPEGSSSYSRADFLRDVGRIREYISKGDCFQTLLSRRIDVPRDFDSTDLYRALRVINPSPYMFHLVMEDLELVGSSPELLVRLADGRVTVRPIAGTRPRGTTSAEDDALTSELLSDEKERAEHLMLVDLGRNDVGRVAEFGSVSVTELMKVERYSHVLHIVSQVEGMAAAGQSAIDVVRATFPAGTMSGAPKVRAMEIIEELEPERRGPYAGALGYIAAGASRMDLAITIRTCVLSGNTASVQAGAGIVAESVAEREWDETTNKARAILTAIGAIRHVIESGL